MVAKVRTLMLIAALTTAVAIAAVLAVIGYRVSQLQGSGPPSRLPPEVTAQLPRGARVLSTATAGDRIVVTINSGGQTEIRTYDLHTLRPAGQLRFEPQP